MASKLSEYSEEESRKLNGQTVMAVLSHLGDAGTADKICNQIAGMVNERKDVVEPEVKRILRRGVSNGFLVKFGKNYLLSGKDDTVEVDSKRRAYKQIGKREATRKRNIKSFERGSHQEPEEFLSVSRKISLKQDETDSADKDNELVMLNPKEVVNAIMSDFVKSVQHSEQTSDEQEQVIDVEDIISRNLNSLSKPCNDTE